MDTNRYVRVGSGSVPNWSTKLWAVTRLTVYSCVPAAKRHVFAAVIPMFSPVFQPRRGFYASNYVLNIC